MEVKIVNFNPCFLRPAEAVRVFRPWVFCFARSTVDSAQQRPSADCTDASPHKNKPLSSKRSVSAEIVTSSWVLGLGNCKTSPGSNVPSSQTRPAQIDGFGSNLVDLSQTASAHTYIAADDPTTIGCYPGFVVPCRKRCQRLQGDRKISEKVGRVSDLFCEPGEQIKHKEAQPCTQPEKLVLIDLVSRVRT